MTRSAAWNSCSSGPDDLWRESQWQTHRNRVEFIQSAKSVSAQAFSNALATSAHPHRIHAGRSNSTPVKLTARLKSPAAKARQKQIDRENLILIKKIIALDNAKTSTGTKKKQAVRTQRHSKATESTSGRNTIVVPQAAHSNHECPHRKRDVQHTAASHVLYTRSSATMKNNYVEYNAPTMFHSSNTTSAAARVRSRTQSKILNENKIILQRILSARTTIDRSALERHEERHNKLRAILSRHHSTPLPLQQQPQSRPLRTSCSQSSLRRYTSDDAGCIDTTTNNEDSAIRVDPVSHLAQQPKRRPRSASQASSRNRVAAACPLPLHTARTSSNESLVSRMRKMTIETQCDDM